MTESSAFANKARQECMEELGVEEFEVVETLDSITCNYCRERTERHIMFRQIWITQHGIKNLFKMKTRQIQKLN